MHTTCLLFYFIFLKILVNFIFPVFFSHFLRWRTPTQPAPATCCQNSYNVMVGNNVSYAGANGIESDFSLGCQFINNTANNCAYGFWLGYGSKRNNFLCIELIHTSLFINFSLQLPIAHHFLILWSFWIFTCALFAYYICALHSFFFHLLQILTWRKCRSWKFYQR